MIIQKFLLTTKFQETQNSPTNFCCLLITKNIPQDFRSIEKFHWTFSRKGIYICMIMQLKKQKQEKMDSVAL